MFCNRRHEIVIWALVSSRRLAMLIAVTAVLAVPVVALGATDRIDGPATPLERADRWVPEHEDVVSVSNSGELSTTTINRAFAAAAQAGGTAVISRSASIGLTRVSRGGSTVQQPPSGFAYPMGVTVLPHTYVGTVMGTELSALLTPTRIVMNKTSADLRGARAGDVLTLTAASGASVNFTIARVAPHDEINGAELLMEPGAADRLGLSRQSTVLVWGFNSRSAINSALSANSLISTSIRVRRTWDAFDPDLTLGMVETKAELGEFAYRVNSNGSVSVDDAWRTANITAGSIGGLRLQTGCHRKVRPALQAAMNEVVAAGLSYTINYYDANRAGGCYYPRFNRLTPNSRIGFLSRHSWGQAVDTNTVGSCQGCIPDFSKTAAGCRTVQIFRKHGFAWGGNFLTPDGMHFEYVGERRDRFAYPSRFCANVTSGLTVSALDTDPAGAANIFDHDGMADFHDHDHDH